MNWTQLVEASLATDAPFEHLRESVRARLAAGDDRDAVYEALMREHLRLRAEGRTDAEDTVADVMDLVVGWCSPASRL